ncbi:bud site selection protein [Ophidiomyces ophidiicola]|uniref:Bud site selection protein n=1 Tax=Ophidiomyces ophidiicola TaxID=1387563 RepID=A0ACB8V2N1_9EURO|nr:bud site selection protein [Ophidiomyces ophidiicola]KAI1911119.1 bud site selection protein [Ophidiomyces ophidiicola]KAI1926405.1 bud site selection protein [Ophidiomyces ophidiicola]KAI1947075.1 bud site selection protein [Ophidiomyces ophidiicola]KAI1954715.1 bud site selection protein [Ophidiomyces ophidiicola]KAI1958070.1 bud site selection protein [Ophidiomyces ophidiicola]
MITPAVPELIEDDQIYASIDARTDSLQGLRELGPPDLVHVVKQSKANAAHQTGVYHHVTGIDASSSASLAAYVNTLTYSPLDKSNKVISGIYCCYNAFSHLDMRVEVKIPGTLESYCIDERGDKRVATEQLWLETFVCAVLRAYSYADDGNGDALKKIVAVRRFNPITNTEMEHKFLDAAEKLFFNASGRQLSSDPETQVPNTVSNHLASGILKYVHTTGRYASGINLFEKLRTKDVEVSSLLARVLISANEEVQAVRLLHDALQDVPMDYALLDCQAAFCQSKEEYEMALECAKRSVTAAPSEFSSWIRLAEVYVDLEQWNLALLTLNSCPMFTYQDKDSPRMPQPSRILLPVLPESVLDEIDEGQPKAGDPHDIVNPILRKLHASSYQGTFLKAYSLLTKIAAAIGWDQLLKVRSEVFVMEEEYRVERHAGASRTTPNNNNASTVALHEASTAGSDVNGNEKNDPGLSEENPNFKTKDEALETNGNTEEPNYQEVGSEIEKPEQSMASEVVKSGGEDPEVSNTYTQFHNKRLCERWLDNLFMVLYEDLRVYTIWRSELAQSRAQSIEYKKSATEWEILGELAERLHHTNEAIEAFQHCLQVRFSAKAMKGILKMYERQNDTRGMLNALIRLIAWQYRWYSEFSPDLLFMIRKLIEEEGAVKVRSIVQATNLPQPVLDLTHHYCQLCAMFRSTGSDG